MTLNWLFGIKQKICNFNWLSFKKLCFLYKHRTFIEKNNNKKLQNIPHYLTWAKRNYLPQYKIQFYHFQFEFFVITSEKFSRNIHFHCISVLFEFSEKHFYCLRAFQLNVYRESWNVIIVFNARHAQWWWERVYRDICIVHVEIYIFGMRCVKRDYEYLYNIVYIW